VNVLRAMWGRWVFAMLFVGAVSLQAQTPAPPPPPLSLAEATSAALRQASAWQQALLDERTAALELAQARAALLPKVRSLSTVTFNQPKNREGVTEPAFLSADAVHQYQELAGVEGALDFGMRASMARARALLAAAHAGTEIARRALVRGVREAYYGLALGTARREAAEESLRAAEEFERVTALQANAGEVPEVDAIRARIQTAQRRDEYEQAAVEERIAAAGLRVLAGYEPGRGIAVSPLTARPAAADVERFTPSLAAGRPEIAQAEANRRAALAGVGVSRAERLPSLTYSVDEGFDAPSLQRTDIREHSGYLATAMLAIPVWDWGAGRARARAAQLAARAAENQLALTRREVEQDFLAAREEALAAVRRADALRAAVDDARRNVDISMARYRAGEAPVLEVTDAVTTLAALRAAFVQALFDFETARARLQEGAGE
jgi:outer membrane protein TolC